MMVVEVVERERQYTPRLLELESKRSGLAEGEKQLTGRKRAGTSIHKHLG